MELKLTQKQFRRLLDLVYIGNWVLNSTRGEDRIREYDQVESLVFSHCLGQGMASLTELYHGELIPSRAFAEGGIHEAIMAYEDTTFFEILAGAGIAGHGRSPHHAGELRRDHGPHGGVLRRIRGARHG